MIETTIIAGFPGVGKSFLHNLLGDAVSDSDSSKFPKEGFPQNYIEHIKSLQGKKQVILISTHKPVLDALEKENLPYCLVHPKRELKAEYLERYKKRGSPEGFIKLLDNSWEIFMDDLWNANPYRRIVLNAYQFLQDKVTITKKSPE